MEFILTWSVFDFDTIDDNIRGPVQKDRAGERVADDGLVYAGSSLQRWQDKVAGFVFDFIGFLRPFFFNETTTLLNQNIKQKMTYR